MVKVKNFAIFCRFVQLKFAESKNVRIFAVLFREHSSVGLEHLPYKQRVGGSTPSAPTKALEKSKAFFVYAQHWLFVWLNGKRYNGHFWGIMDIFGW